MKKINIFNSASRLYPFRWMVVIAFALAALLGYYNLSGKRLFDSSDTSTWNSSGPRYHK